MLIIDDKPNPDRGKLMAKFNVENNMRTLKITMENNDNPSGRIIKLCASVKKGLYHLKCLPRHIKGDFKGRR